MELNKTHREALIAQLSSARYSLNILDATIIRYKKKDDKDSIIDWFNVERYLYLERIKIIERALIDSEIDY